MLVHHFAINVKDLARSKAFYTPLMKLLGADISFEVPDRYCGYANNAFGLGQDSTGHPSQIHIAFSANSQAQVDEFHKKALELGGKCNGKPGLRTQYAPTYYAAFVHDADGNNIEVVHLSGAYGNEKAD
ncbi:unnamed protein product [Absidia cylindrospora]